MIWDLLCPSISFQAITFFGFRNAFNGRGACDMCPNGGGIIVFGDGINFIDKNHSGEIIFLFQIYNIIYSQGRTTINFPTLGI